MNEFHFDLFINEHTQKKKKTVSCHWSLCWWTRSTLNQQKPVRNSFKLIYSEPTGLLCLSMLKTEHTYILQLRKRSIKTQWLCFSLMRFENIRISVPRFQCADRVALVLIPECMLGEAEVLNGPARRLQIHLPTCQQTSLCLGCISRQPRGLSAAHA